MKRTTIHPSIVGLGTVLIGGIPLGTALASPVAAAHTGSSHVTAIKAKTAKSQTFSGPMEYVDHGPVQVSIVVKSKRITGVRVTNSPEGGRSVFIQDQAIPILKQETLQAQSANINEVSGATDTSGGYITSLQSAINKAKKARALK